MLKRSKVDIISKLKHLEPHLHSQPQRRSSLSRKDLVRWIPGEEIHNEQGQCYKTVTSYSSDQIYGKNLRDEYETLEGKSFMLAGKDENLRNFNYKKALFVDTETTGLSGGTGTVPFLIGIGYFRDNQFVIEQYMMRDYDEEAALLQALEPRFREREFIISYNGKSYDVNILTTRLILNRMNNYLHDLHHFDLLYTVRRIWGARLQDCSLLNVERCIFDFYREDDIPGYLIPSLYFEYISSGNGSKMVQVFQHNRLDILTLAVLAGHTARIYLNPEECLDHSLDFASIARSFENLDEYGKASLCYKKALERELLHSDREEILFRLGYLFKRKRYWRKATKIWEYIIEHYVSSFTAYEELAKYYEHKAKDFKKASVVVHKALKRLEIQEELAGEGGQEKTRLAFEYRLKRLQRKELQKVGN